MGRDTSAASELTQAVPLDTATSRVAWHALDPAEAATRLGTDIGSGLREPEVHRRQARVGANTPVTARDPSLWRILLRQFRSGLPAPLLPVQILWVNLVTDILPAVALIRDPAEPDVMRRPPRERSEALVTWRFAARVLSESAVLGAGVLAAYFSTVAAYGAGPRANTVAFLALVLSHPLQAMHCRSRRTAVWQLPPNRLIVISLLTLITAVQGMAISWSPLATILGTTALARADWLVAAVGVLWPVILLEVLKVIALRRRLRSMPRAGRWRCPRRSGESPARTASTNTRSRPGLLAARRRSKAGESPTSQPARRRA